MLVACSTRYSYISIHAPHTRSDRLVRLRELHFRISIHAPHTRSDLRRPAPACLPRHFNPRSSYEERPHAHGSISPPRQHFNPRSSYEERPAEIKRKREYYIISIHAPHTRSDSIAYFTTPLSHAISIHAPHTRSDVNTPMRKCAKDISIHAPHTRSDTRGIYDYYKNGGISIHAPHTRSDGRARAVGSGYDYFNPRSSYEERLPTTTAERGVQISIHAPHTRSDQTPRQALPALKHFNPRSSYEERPRHPNRAHHHSRISIHAPHTRSDT